jgi:thymidylate synthase
MSKNIEHQYLKLLKDILDNGVEKQDRTGTGTLSVFGRQIRHDMSLGFPLLTTKKMYWKGIVTELLWFLRGDTNIKFLVDNDCHIWEGDAYKNYKSKTEIMMGHGFHGTLLSKEEFINRIKTDDEFAKNWGELGPIYGKQWRKWKGKLVDKSKEFDAHTAWVPEQIDQIANLINDLKTNPDSRRLMVNAWNVAEIDQMTLPPCHYGFQVYTRELSQEERYNWYTEKYNKNLTRGSNQYDMDGIFGSNNIPTRAISLMWNQRSVDTFLGLPFNIASYGLLLEIIAKAVNMVPDELIGNLGDTHLYLNHIEQAKEQIGRELTLEERYNLIEEDKHTQFVNWQSLGTDRVKEVLDKQNIPTRTREPYSLPTLNINTEFWPTESGECGIGGIDAAAVFHPDNVHFYKCLLEEDIQLSNYQSHPPIKAQLSN